MKSAWATLAILGATLGCDAVLGIRPTESGRDAAVTPDLPVAGEDSWSCVGNVDLDEKSTAIIPVDLIVFDVETHAIPPGLSVVVCRPLSCTNPVAGPLGTNDGGLVHLLLPADFIGYLTVQSDTTLPAIVQIVRPVGKMTKFMPIELVGAQTVAAVAARVTTAIDPSRGLLLLQALDCSGNRGVGVAFRLEEPAQGVQDFYFLNNVPTITDTGTDLMGGGGLVNVPTGFVAVHAMDVATGKLLSNFSVEMQAGWVTYATVEPQ